MGRLSGKRIVITGSSRSLGRHFALACAAEGASLIVNGTNEIALAAVAAEIAALGTPVHAVRGSVAETSVCNALVDTCVERFGGIDVLVNNAGIVRDRTLLKMSDDDFDEVIAVNLRGPFLCTRRAALAMSE
jgi:3-oxoacyl-[acyl-carrier protein] reductase